MDNFLINMTLATCNGWIMDNLPIIMTLGTPPTPTWDSGGRWRELVLGHICHHSSSNIAQLSNQQCRRKWVKYCLPICLNYQVN